MTPHRKSPHSRSLTLALVVAAAFATASCVTSDDADPPATDRSASGPLAGVPDVNDSQRGDLTRRLAAIDDNLVEDVDLAVTRSRFVCKQVVEGVLTAEQLSDYTVEQFEGGAVTAVTPGGAVAIVAAVKASFCPDPNAVPSPSKS